MFCPKCGKEIEDDAVICVHCGRSLKVEQKDEPQYQASKSGIGVLLGLFLGLIGLVIGLLMYPQDTNARKTFLKAWGITYAIEVVLIIILYAVMISAGLSGIYY